MNNKTKTLLAGTVGAAGLLAVSAQPASANTTVKIQPGDSVWHFAQKYGVSIQSIETLNKINSDTHLIYAGSSLEIPTANKAATPKQTSTKPVTNTYVVKTGDTLWSIARAHNMSVDSLRSMNNIASDNDLIIAGQTLSVVAKAHTTPGATAATTQTATSVTERTPQVVPAKSAAVATTQQAAIPAPATTTTTESQTSSAQTSSASSIATSSSTTTSATQQPTTAAPTVATSSSTEATTTTTSSSTDAKAETSVAATPAPSQTSTTTQTAPATTAVTSQQANTTAAIPTVHESTQATAPTATDYKQAATNPVSSASNAAAVTIAQKYLGTPYVWGGTTPSGFDCSGFTQYVYAQLGKSIGRNTIAQESAGTQIAVSQAQPGDLLFWGSKGNTYHVAIYAGNNTYIAAPQEGQNVSYGNMAYYMPSFAVHVN